MSEFIFFFILYLKKIFFTLKIIKTYLTIIADTKMANCDNCDPILMKILDDLQSLKERLFHQNLYAVYM